LRWRVLHMHGFIGSRHALAHQLRGSISLGHCIQNCWSSIRKTRR
jgi:hypothetical protein